MTNAGWMTDALQIAEGIIAEGEGDLTKMGEFEDVEFKVSTGERSRLLSAADAVD